MIVNPAYMHMGIADEPAEPVIWDRYRVFNYPYQLNGANIAGNNGLSFAAGGSVTFSDLNLSKFTKITFTEVYQINRQMSIIVKAVNDKGVVSTETELKFPANTLTNQIWTIPPAFRIKNVKLVVTGGSINGSSSVTISKAVCS